MRRFFFIVVSLPSLGVSQEKTTFDDHVFPIFQQACLNCHNPDKAKGGLDLSSFSAAIKGGSGGKIVEPGDGGCALVAAVRQTGEKKMPPEGEKLSENQIRVITRWIDGGLLENLSSVARKASKPKFETLIRTNPATRPDGPPPMPQHVLLEPPVITSKSASIHALAASPWAPLIAITGQRQILLHHTDSLDLVGIFPFPEGEPASLAFTPDGRHLIVGGGVPGKSGMTITFDVRTGQRLLESGKEFDSVLATDIRPSLDIVATGGPSRLLKIWSTETGDLVRAIKKHTDWITALDLSADGVLLASGDRNGGVWVWESETGSEFQTLRGHQAAITTVAFRADSNLLATASEDGSVRFWEMNGGSEVKKIDAHPGGTTAFAFARNGNSITAGRDMKAKFWKPDFTLGRDLAQNLPSLPTAVALDPEGERAFIGDAHGTIRVLQTIDGTLVGSIQANPPSIQTRLQKLAIEIALGQQAHDSAKQILAEKIVEQNAAGQSLADAEITHRLAAELAATAGVARPENDGSATIAAERGIADLQSAEKVISQKKLACETAEKAVAEARAISEAAGDLVEKKQAAAKGWAAAAINTRALNTRREADESALALEESQLNFTTAAAETTIQAAALNDRKGSCDRLAEFLTSNTLHPQVADEARATMTAIKIKIARDREALCRVEDALLSQRNAVEQNASRAHKTADESDSLRKIYLKSLE